jgi:D-alanyl-lipoteichoic acid acyltransferase DltB (MBOAT superfamily)
MQLYFDFSGYCDMAIGVSRMFNIDLPLNFYSPYKSTSIIEFWRRWHMTLSRFLRDYLYIPLGGARRGTARRYLNLVVTMLLGGLWHGAAWTFVAWGGLHALYLLANHAFRASYPVRLRGAWGGQLCGFVLTFLCVTVAWVFFRADDLATAFRILNAMCGLGSGWRLSVTLLRSELPEAFFLIILGLAVVWFLPNVQQLFRFPIHPISDHSGLRESNVSPEPADRLVHVLSWKPSISTMSIFALLAAASVLFLVRTSKFLYFQF